MEGIQIATQALLITANVGISIAVILLWRGLKLKAAVPANEIAGPGGANPAPSGKKKGLPRRPRKRTQASFKSFGERMKSWRERLGLSVAEAEKLSGVSKTTIYNIERGVSNPYHGKVEKNVGKLKTAYKKVEQERGKVFDLNL